MRKLNYGLWGGLTLFFIHIFTLPAMAQDKISPPDSMLVVFGDTNVDGAHVTTKAHEIMADALIEQIMH